MTVTNTGIMSERTYIATAGQTVFVFPLQVPAPGDVSVYVNQVLNALGTHYNITGYGSDAGVTITFFTAMAGGERVDIILSLAYTQPTNYVTGSTFQAEQHEDALDRQALIGRQLRDMIGKAPRFGPFSPYRDIPFPDLVPGQVLATNGAGTGLIWRDVPTTPVVGSINAVNVTYDSGTNVDAELDAQRVKDTDQDTTIATLQAQIVALQATITDQATRLARIEVHARKRPLVTDSPWLADATGATDAWPAFAQCRDDTGGTFDVPPGNFLLLSPLAFTAQLNIHGAGRLLTNLIYRGSQDCIQVRTGAFSWTIRDLCIRHDRTTGTPTAGAAIEASGGNFGVCDNVQLTEPYHGVYVRPATGTASQANRFTNFNVYAHEGSAFHFDGTLAPIIDQVVEHAIIQGYESPTNIIKGPGVGVYQTGQCEGNFIIGGDCTFCQRGIWITAPTLDATKHPTSVYIWGVQIDSNALGLSADHVGYLYMYHCWIATSEANGIYLSNVIGADIAGCEIYNNGFAGVYVAQGCIMTRIHDNGILGNSVGHSNQYSGVVLESGVSDFLVVDNTSGVVPGLPSSATQKYGVELAVGASDRYRIEGNLIAGNLSGGVADGGTGSNKRVSGNY